jgi:hypothetical protein
MVKHAAAMRLPAAMVSQRPIGGRDRDSVTMIDAATTNSTNTAASITRLVSVAPAPVICNGSFAWNKGSTRTESVKFSAGPVREGWEPACFMSSSRSSFCEEAADC